MSIKVLILAALPQEYSPLKRLFPSWRLVRRTPFKRFAFNLPGKEIILIETGMGQDSAREALMEGLTVALPDLLIFSGFAGGLHPDLPVGAVCFVQSARELSSGNVFKIVAPELLFDFLSHNQIRPVLAFSAETPGNKTALSALASGQPAVLDMETSAIADIALHNHIPFICLRAVSDAIGHELGFNLSDIADGRGRARITGVLATVIRKPSSVTAFYLAWRRSRHAAKNLCGAVAALLNIPAPVLRKMAREIRIE